MRYAAYDSVTGQPHVVVDGAPQAGTVLTLSHWPRSATPAALQRDLSAEIAFAYLDRPELHVDAAVVTNNHPDEDGITSVYVLVDPAAASSRRDLVIETARAGDFSTTHSRAAARAAFAISALVEDADSDPYPTVLERLTAVFDDPERFRDLWEREDAELQAGLDAIAGGAVTIEEHPEVDLAVVTVPQAQRRPHAIAVHNATDRFRVLYVHGRHYEVVFRYETWVQFVSRPVMPRVDLAPLAQLLADLDGSAWKFDGAGSIIPSLRRVDGGECSLDPHKFGALLHDALQGAPPAWDPFGR
ncbi:MAG: DUF6687 family protein [Acidimicrobiia bacterium]